jgi:LysM repeat protein
MERLITATTLLALAIAAPATAQTLRGSRASVERQHQVALEHDYSFLRSSSQVRRFASNGLLLSVPGNANYELAGVSFPFARPAVKTFVERLSRQYRAACGERLVVTSLTRPTTRQPRNASDQSVHPAGMAADLRISRSSKCRGWLESVLLDLERKGVLEATRERRPAHYHVAVFPNPYLVYIGQLALPKKAEPKVAVAEPEPEVTTADAEQSTTADGAETASTDKEVMDTVSVSSVVAPARTRATAVYRVNRGDTLWDIARQHGMSVSELKALNGMTGNGLKPGQRLKVPTRSY